MSADEVLFHDGFGDRLQSRDTYGKPEHESLLLRAELCAVPSFEFSLNQRLTQLEQFDHPAFVRARSLVRVPGRMPRLSLAGDCAGGTRLSDVLAAMELSSNAVPVGAVLFVAREILSAVTALHRQSSDIAHGALAPERVVVNGKIRITDYVLGSAIEQLRFSPERYWKELRVAVPASAGASHVDRRADVAQVGMIALAMFAGRPLREHEHMSNVGQALTGLALPDPIKTWLLRMLHLDLRRAYVGVIEAAQELEEAIVEGGVPPVPLVLSAMGIRTHRISAPVTVRIAQPKASSPIAPVKKPAVRTAPRSDTWNTHDVDPGRRFAGDGLSGTAGEAPHGWFGARLKLIMKLGLLGVSLAGAFTAAQFVPAPAILFSQTGTLVVESNPAGATLLVDGEVQGHTPLTLKLKSGPHEVELRGGGTPRSFKVDISSGASVSQHVEMRGPNPRPRKPNTSSRVDGQVLRSN